MQTNTAWGTKEKSQQANKPLSWILKDEDGLPSKGRMKLFQPKDYDVFPVRLVLECLKLCKLMRSQDEPLPWRGHALSQ